jgi:hypothetical protein
MRLHLLFSILQAIVMVQAGCYTSTTGDYGLSMAHAGAQVDNLCDGDFAGYF